MFLLYLKEQGSCTYQIKKNFFGKFHVISFHSIPTILIQNILIAFLWIVACILNKVGSHSNKISVLLV
jgi:hypothetical protein